MPGWVNHKLESRLPGEISTTSDMHMIPPNGRKPRGTKEPLDESERGRRVKSWLKLNIQKTKIMASPHIMVNKREKVETVTDFYFLELQNHCRW